MNAKICIILIISCVLGADAIEIGLIQEYGGSVCSHVYNSTIVLCQNDGTGCEYDMYHDLVYHCDAIDEWIMCGKTIATTDLPGTVLCDSPEGCAEGYYCDKLDKFIECGKDIVVPDNGTIDVPSDSTECPDLPEPMVIVPRLGKGTFEPPDPESLIHTSEWGDVPADEILVVIKSGCDHCDAWDLANKLEGKVVGYIDFINLYQIKTTGRDETDLRTDLFQAESNPNVISTFPHQKVFAERSPLEDPVYVNGGDRSYQIAGVPQSWDMIRSSGISLNKAKVGVVDDGLYKGYGEFDGVVRIDTKSKGSLLERPSPGYEVAGSHGTGIMNLIAADADNGGLVGIASEPLRDSLSVVMINMQSSIYSKSGDAWYMGYMLALCKAAIGSDILSISWGNSEAAPDAVSESRDFFNEWADTYPDRLFICSAGNDGMAMDGSRRFPYTYQLPNVITVGCINNDGTLNEFSNKASDNFEVTLAAPGDQAVWGCDNQGQILCSGGETSMSVPFVTSAAALIRSLDPSLNAADIKSLLVETARTSISDAGGIQVAAPEEVGGRILAIDLSVEKVIENLKRSSSGA